MDKATVEKAISKVKAAGRGWIGYDWQRDKWMMANISGGRDAMYRGSVYWYRVGSFDTERIIEDMEAVFAW